MSKSVSSDVYDDFLSMGMVKYAKGSSEDGIYEGEREETTSGRCSNSYV
jgi:hypothetical protein